MDRITHPAYDNISYTWSGDWMESTKDGKCGRRGWVPRFTVRRLMVAVAIVALLSGMERLRQRSVAFSSMANYHVIKNSCWAGKYAKDYEKGAAYHSLMWQKYDRAARYPWLSVEPDPPKPM